MSLKKLFLYEGGSRMVRANSVFLKTNTFVENLQLQMSIIWQVVFDFIREVP